MHGLIGSFKIAQRFYLLKYVLSAQTPRVESCSCVSIIFFAYPAICISNSICNTLFAFWYAVHESCDLLQNVIKNKVHTDIPHYLLSIVIKFEWMLLLFGLNTLGNWLQYANINFGCNEIYVIYILKLRKYLYAAKAIWVSYKHVYSVVDIICLCIYFVKGRNVKEVYIQKMPTPNLNIIIRTIINFTVSLT